MQTPRRTTRGARIRVGIAYVACSLAGSRHLPAQTVAHTTRSTDPHGDSPAIARPYAVDVAARDERPAVDLSALSARNAGEAGATVGRTAAGTVAVELYRGRALDVVLREIATLPALRVLRRFSSTTAVYHVELEGGVEIAFKPATRTFPSLWHNDVAGYRLARLLGLGERSPPAVSRRLPLSLFAQHVARDGLLASREDSAQVWGAAIFWIPRLGHTTLHTPEGEARWRRWLDASETLRDRDRAQAEAVSSLLLFDYLQANEDRWNAGNLRTDESGGLLLRDNNGGWWTHLLSNPQTGAWRLFASQRFRRSVVDALENASAAQLRSELARDPNASSPLVPERNLHAYERRRAFALRYVRACTRRFGERRVFEWP